MPNYNNFHNQIMCSLSGKNDKARSEIPLLHDEWYPNKHYNDGKDGVNPISYVRRGEQLYKCLTEHDSQPTWTPEDSPSLWVKVMYREGIRIIPEIITATEAFALDERGWWGDTVFVSKMNNNVWTPEQYPQAWNEEVEVEEMVN